MRDEIKFPSFDKFPSSTDARPELAPVFSVPPTEGIMATSAFVGLLARPSENDADLLRRFMHERDEAAFTELVRRHGPMVLGVCGRTVKDWHLAEDTFQSVFVLLAQRANTLDLDRPLGPWLYGVAYRMALGARTMMHRRQKRERGALLAREPEVAGTEPDDAVAVLDEEIAKLSVVCREAIILCELQGVSRKEAAQRLGIAEGTLSSRLASGRKILADRLQKRGVTLTVSLGTATALSGDLLATTVGLSLGKLQLSVHLTQLIQGATHMALLSKLKLGIVATILLLATAYGSWVSRPITAAALVPTSEKDDGLIWALNDKTGTLTAYAPNGAKKQEVLLKDRRNFQGFTHDGESLLFLAEKGVILDDEADESGLTLHIGKPDNLGGATDTGIKWRKKDSFSLMRDGKQVLRMHHDRNGMRGDVKTPHLFTHVLIDITTKKESVIPLLEGVQLCMESIDGKEWIALHNHTGIDPKLPNYRWVRVPREGGDLMPICDGYSLPFFRISLDQKLFVAVGHRHTKEILEKFTCYRGDLLNGEVTEIGPISIDDQPNLVISPDNQKFGMKSHRDADVYSADTDGKNRKKMFTISTPDTYLIGWFPWKPKDSR